jgi:hypothetical protein
LTEDLTTLLNLLKEAAQGKNPDDTKTDPQILDGIRAYGAAAVEPLVSLIADTLAAAWDGPNGEATSWNYADVYAVDLLVQLPLSAPAVRKLLDLISQYEDDDWYSEEIGRELWHAGEVVIEPCLAVLHDRSLHEHERNCAAGLLEELAKDQPDLRDRIADGLVEVMSSVGRENETWDDWAVNAFMLGALGETRAERYIPFVQQMFELDRVDVMILDQEWVLDTIQGKDPMERHKDNFDPDSDEIDLKAGLERAQSFFEALKSRKSPGESPWSSAPQISPPPPTSGPGLPGYWEQVVAPKRPGRNDPCWCGSGKKYKRCHMREDQEKDRQARRRT